MFNKALLIILSLFFYAPCSAGETQKPHAQPEQAPPQVISLEEIINLMARMVDLTPALFNGPIQDVNRIEIVSNVRDSSGGGSRYMNDEYAFSVYRARVKVGTQVMWVNNGRLKHTVSAEDGSWTTGDRKSVV